MESRYYKMSEDLLNQTIYNDKEIEAIRHGLQVKTEDLKDFALLYDGVKIQPRFNRGYPNPTINHLNFARYIKNNPDLVDGRKIIDMGCGSGFLGTYTKNKTNPSSIVFADMNIEALQHSLLSYASNNLAKGLELLLSSHEKISGGDHFIFNNGEVEVISGNVINTFTECHLDENTTAFCAPMYLPGICEVFPQVYQIFAKATSELGIPLVIGHYSAASSVIEEVADSLGLHLRDLDKTTVPFHIEYVTEKNTNIVDNKDLLKELKIVNGIPKMPLMISEMYYK